MADRTFDYDIAKETYQAMQKTTDLIAEALDKANKAVDETVNVEDQAIYGDLGAQLKMDWDNSASCFPTFLNWFGSWSTVVAQSSGNYAEFEEKVKGFNPDGTAVSADGTGQVAPLSISPYNAYYTDNYDEYVNNGGTGTVDTTVVTTATMPDPTDASATKDTDTGEKKDDGTTKDEGKADNDDAATDTATVDVGGN